MEAKCIKDFCLPELGGWQLCILPNQSSGLTSLSVMSHHQASERSSHPATLSTPWRQIGIVLLQSPFFSNNQIFFERKTEFITVFVTN